VAPPGLTVGGYTLLTRIGEGGMGVVHLAQQPGGPRVALKVLRPHIVGDDEARARLAREVGSLSRIRSARIAEIVDADPWGPVPFVATRYVPGLSLHDHVIEEGPIEGADLTWFAVCLAEAVAAVHACDVLHRDVKPSNVLMEGRSPVLIDFGLARVADDPRLTHTGWLLGTPGYLAPEILYGQDATTASDVHSWAATVAYAGTGHPPFGRGPSMAIMDRVRRGEHDLSGLPDPLRPVVAAALDPDPDRRPDLSQILAHLRTLRSPAPATAPRPAAPEDPFTMPLAVAALSDAREATAPEAAPAEIARPLPPTRVETAYPPPVQPSSVQPAPMAYPATPAADYPLPVWFEPPPAPLGERLRRAAFTAAVGLLVAAVVAAYPIWGTVGVLFLAWLLRSGSLAGSAASTRRQLRGNRWYDSPQVMLATPWHLVQSIPGTIMLALWAGGLSLAGGLLGYAFFGTGERRAAIGILATAGLLLAVALWCGPGASRVRGPLQRITHPLAARPVAWFIALLVVLAAASGVAELALERGPNTAPVHNLTLP